MIQRVLGVMVYDYSKVLYTPSTVTYEKNKPIQKKDKERTVTNTIDLGI